MINTILFILVAGMLAFVVSNLHFDGDCRCYASKTENTGIISLPEADASQEGHIVTLVELGSVNCIPCRMMQPVMRRVEQKYGSQVKVVFHDVWTPHGNTYARRYGIQGIPTQVFLDKYGKEYFRHAGFFPFEEVYKVLRKGGVR
ncbi:MAG: thioredoxin family protein [Spirochaetes bacterium]|nr:thioredoxin family protein [Spirochaetota bacterium]